MHTPILTGSAKAEGTYASTASMQVFMERDMSEQVEWLAQRARHHGYADLDDLLGTAPAVYTQLAETWRQAHPLSEAAWT
jgi:hypothetical protein